MKKKLIGLSVLLFVYIFAIGIGIGSYILFNYLGLHDFLSILIADVIATIFVWLLGVIFKTASMYDPYWSIQSLVIYLGLLIKYNNWNRGTILLLVVIAIYSIRLTTNFIIGFDSLSYVDWRYKMLKAFLSIKPVYSMFSEMIDLWKNMQGSEDYRNASPVMKGCLVKAVNEDLSHLFEKNRYDTLLIWGDNDDATPLSDGQLMEEKMPHAGLAVISGTGHFSFAENVQVFNSIMKNYLL